MLRITIIAFHILMGINDKSFIYKLMVVCQACTRQHQIMPTVLQGRGSVGP